MWMNYRDISLRFAVFLVFWGKIEVGFAGNDQSGGNNYISWDDMKVNTEEVLMFLRGDRNLGRVILVDKNGRGDSVTVQGAVDMVPLHNSQRVKIYIFPGVYREKVSVPVTKPYVSFIGNQKHWTRTIITWNNKASDKGQNGVGIGMVRTASVSIESDYFCATGITIMNSWVPEAGDPGNQAVALKLSGDKAVLYKVRILGTQDTLLDDYGSHYFEQCFIEGTVDFICGKARSLYRNCDLHSRAKGYGAIAAHHRDSPQEDTGYSFVNCTVRGTGEVLLGRAWGNYSRVVYSHSKMNNIINSFGWSDFGVTSRQRTAMFGEYKNEGKGANLHNRVKWSKSLTDNEARPFLDKSFIHGDQWLRL